MPTIPQFDLSRWQGQFEANRLRLRALALAEDCAPVTGQWSAAECIEHLEITADRYLQDWQEVLNAGKGSAGRPYAWWWRWFLNSMLNPARLRSKTPAAFVPTSETTLPAAVRRYEERREQIPALVRQMLDKESGSVRIASPFASWLRYPLDFSFDLWLAHEVRHLQQAERMIRPRGKQS